MVAPCCYCCAVHLLCAAEKNDRLAGDFCKVVDLALMYDDYNFIKGEPELGGVAVNRLLKSTLLAAFFKDHGRTLGGASYGPGHACNTHNVYLSFWTEYTSTMIFLRESGVNGQEPLKDFDLERVDLSIRKQRVWLGTIAPDNGVLYACWYAWVHTYYVHIMFFVRKYRGIGTLSQEPIEDAHKQVHRDVATYSVAGTRPATPAAWRRIGNGYNIDLVALRDHGQLRNGGSIDDYLCTCNAKPGTRCRRCQKADPYALLE